MSSDSDSAGLIQSCLFCCSEGPYNTVEHIIPESIGNEELILRNEVCDSCQSYFGSEVEQFVLSKTPIGFWRVLLGVPTKKGKLPKIDFTLPSVEKGTIPTTSSQNDDRVSFAAEDDGSTSVVIDDPKLVAAINRGEKKKFQFVLTPLHLVQMGRFLGKVGLELTCDTDPVGARETQFDAIRNYARRGIKKEPWPIFHARVGTLEELETPVSSDDQDLREVVCSEFQLHRVADRYEMFSLKVGLDMWVICLNDPYPAPEIRGAFPRGDLQLLWYPRDTWPKPAPNNDASH